MDILDVARTFLYMDSMSHKKLQKLCYYAQAWYVTIKNKPLFEDDIEAWVHGTVVPSLYSQYKTYGSRAIPREVKIPNNVESNIEICEFLQNIYKVYGHLSANELELLTHTEDPWINARQGKSEWQPGYDSISLDDMKRYYSNLK